MHPAWRVDWGEGAEEYSAWGPCYCSRADSRASGPTAHLQGLTGQNGSLLWWKQTSKAGVRDIRCNNLFYRYRAPIEEHWLHHRQPNSIEFGNFFLALPLSSCLSICVCCVCICVVLWVQVLVDNYMFWCSFSDLQIRLKATEALVNAPRIENYGTVASKGYPMKHDCIWWNCTIFLNSNRLASCKVGPERVPSDKWRGCGHAEEGGQQR